MDPRLMVCLAYIVTAAGIYNLTRLDLTTSFAHVTEWRMVQMIALPFIFIPISTLNYVGVPATKTNQISSLSNFARNLGGSAGTALLTTYIARSSQVHQVQLAANVVPGSVRYNLYTGRMRDMFITGGMTPLQATQAAIGAAYQTMVREATMLSYRGAFAILALAVLVLSPLPFLMRLPPKRGPKPAPEELAAH
jgi:DHA2 family multidrug resistance protein